MLPQPASGTADRLISRFFAIWRIRRTQTARGHRPPAAHAAERRSGRSRAPVQHSPVILPGTALLPCFFGGSSGLI